METPTSSRRVTRSQTLAAINNTIPVSKGNIEGSEKSASKTRRNRKQPQEGSALIDITNVSSPIAGLAMETPSSVVRKQRSNNGAKNVMMMMTPGSGEALLRRQVKTLLQKVEEEAVVLKLQFASRPFIHLQSPMGLVAPENTPQLLNLSEDGNGGIKDLPVFEEQLNMSEVVSGNFDGDFVIKRSLLMDFAEKSDGVDEEDDGGLVDELCKGISKISMAEMFTGKHTRFIYNSDGEIEGEKNIIRLKPTPKGKHLRFPMEEEGEQDQ